MVVEKDKTIVNGSNALKTTVAVERKKVEKQKRTGVKVDKQKIIRKRLGFIRNVACSFVVGVFILSRYSTIYNTQIQINDKKDEISKLKADNESIKVQLIKFNNLAYIEDVAVNKLDMKKPEASKALYMDLESKEVSPKNDNANKDLSDSSTKKIFEKLKKLLF
ncbi:septum formation initiator family protein [Clostridium senegalense]|uniref:septum formation initiator family protein n=1 Tax=Clostridium senegalense TaxID=1465809 RepID=UPI001C10AE44|nr:septum formation initiator family protein [Clostridium senegalense]MBU5225352.1 septum formation initiator family protein [Clostridium senegalense]